MGKTWDADAKYEITRESYDKVAEEFAQKHADPSRIVPIMAPFIDQLPVGGIILDAGCGPGRDAKVFLQRGFRVVGVDFSKEMARLAGLVPGLEIHLSDFRDLDFADSTFDGIWANASLHHLDKQDLVPVLCEFARILKPGGVLFIGVKRGRLEGFTEEYPECPRFYKQYWWDDIGNILDNLHLDAFRTNTCPSGTRPARWLFVYAVKPRERQLILDGGFDCRLCRITRERGLVSGTASAPAELYDRPLCVSKDFVVFPSLGQIVEGYTHIVSREHILSMGALSAAAWGELEEVKKHIRCVMEPEFGPITFFEHGTVDEELASGSSVSHAHLHAAPAPAAFLQAVLSSQPFQVVQGGAFARESFAAGKSYLLLEGPDGISYGCCPYHGLPRQYLRRHLARATGEIGRWNWQYYPFQERVSRTLERLRTRYGSDTF